MLAAGGLSLNPPGGLKIEFSTALPFHCGSLSVKSIGILLHMRYLCGAKRSEFPENGLSIKAEGVGRGEK